MDDKIIEESSNHKKSYGKLLKIEVWRGPKSKKNEVWRRLGGSWRGVMLETFFGGIWANMGATWAKLETRWQQVGPKMGHVSAKMAMLGSLWETLAEFGEHCLSILADALDIKKH